MASIPGGLASMIQQIGVPQMAAPGVKAREKPASVAELLQLNDILATTTPLPTQLGNPTGQQTFAPGGPQVSFTGGALFQPNENPAILKNALVLATRLNQVRGKMRRKQKEQQAQKTQGAR